MAVTYTVNAIKDDIERKGRSLVPFSTVEHVLGQSYTDDNVFDTAISDLVAAKDWVTGYVVDWINRAVLFTGPYTEPGGP